MAFKRLFFIDKFRIRDHIEVIHLFLINCLAFYRNKGKDKYDGQRLCMTILVQQSCSADA